MPRVIPAWNGRFGLARAGASTPHLIGAYLHLKLDFSTTTTTFYINPDAAWSCGDVLPTRNRAESMKIAHSVRGMSGITLGIIEFLLKKHGTISSQIKKRFISTIRHFLFFYIQLLISFCRQKLCSTGTGRIMKPPGTSTANGITRGGTFICICRNRCDLLLPFNGRFEIISSR